MDEFERSLIVTLIGIIASKSLDEIIELLKRKASKDKDEPKEP